MLNFHLDWAWKGLRRAAQFPHTIALSALDGDVVEACLASLKTSLCGTLRPAIRIG